MEKKKSTWVEVCTLLVAIVAAGASGYVGYKTLTQESKKEVHERYSDFVEKIGSTSPDVRMGGIYALEELNKESEINHQQMLEILTAFIRGHSPRPPKLITPKKKPNEYCFGLKEPEVDVAAAMKVLARKSHADERPDLRYTELARLKLSEKSQLPNVNLKSTDLRCSILRGVNLENSELSGTWMTWTDLTNANLRHAKHLDEVFWRHTTCPDGTESQKDGKGIETCIGHLTSRTAQSPTPSGG